MNPEDWPKATEATLKRQLIQYLEALRGRHECYSIRFVTSRLKAAKLPSAQGWAPLLEKYAETVMSKERLIECLTEVASIYSDSLAYGNRAIFIYSVGDGEALDAATHIAGLIDKESDFAEHFPLPLSEAKLRRASFSGVFCSLSKEEDGAVRAYACCKRAFRTRETIDTTVLDDSSRSKLAPYDEVIGVRSGFVQGFDSIVFRPSNNTVEIHVDITCRLTKDDFFKARDFYASRINSYFADRYETDQWLLLSKNFFPLISALYKQEGGFVNSLGHATTTNSIKDERMRGRRSDLRVEDFHGEGMKAINGLTDEYSIRKAWPSADGLRSPTVSIPGHFSLANSADARVGYAIIDACANGDDFAMVMSKLA